VSAKPNRANWIGEHPADVAGKVVEQAKSSVGCVLQTLARTLVLGAGIPISMSPIAQRDGRKRSLKAPQNRFHPCHQFARLKGFGCNHRHPIPAEHPVGSRCSSPSKKSPLGLAIGFAGSAGKSSSPSCRVQISRINSAGRCRPIRASTCAPWETTLLESRSFEVDGGTSREISGRLLQRIMLGFTGVL